MIEKKWNTKHFQNALSLNKKIETSIKGISINTRSLKKNNLFLPLKGKRFDGHQYIHEAFKKGASLSLANKKNYKSFNLQKFKKKIILVDSVISSLHKLAKYSRKNIDGKVIGITGSVGKTSIKDAITLILKKKNEVQSSSGNFNNLIGMPINLANFHNNYEINILELGMNKPGEIKKLSHICKPDISLITKISDAHIGNFKSLKEIVLAKSEIFLGMKKNGTAIINNFDPYYYILKRQLKNSGIKNIINFGNSKNCDVKLIKYKYENNICRIFVNAFGKKINYCLKNLGDHWIENSLSIISVIFALNKNIESYLGRFEKIEAIKGRGKITNKKFNNKNIVLIDDSYNSSPKSLEASIQFLKRFGQKKRKVCVIGDMLELGKFSKKSHENLKRILENNNIYHIYTIGNEMKSLFNILSKNFTCKHAKDLNELYTDLKKNIKNNDIILFKGSRSMHLDKIIKKIK